MNRLLALSLLLLSLGAPVRAVREAPAPADANAVLGATAARDADLVTASPPPLAPASPSRIPELLATTRARIEALEARAREAGQAESEALQREIQDLKASAESQRLQLVAEECRRAGRLEEAQSAERALARLNETPAARPLVAPLSLEEKEWIGGRHAARSVAPAPSATVSSTEGGAQ